MKAPDPITVKEPIDLFKEKAAEYSKVCQVLVNCGIIAYKKFDVDSSMFHPMYKKEHDVRYDSPFEPMFKWLSEYENYPCLYRWKVIPPYDGEKIKNAVMSQSEKGFNVPYVDTNAETETDTLYIGKVQSCIWGRQIEHLGYHKQNKSHHGLHLHEWVKDMNLKMELQVFVFPKECIPLIETFEHEFAKEYRPLIGSHK